MVRLWDEDSMMTFERISTDGKWWPVSELGQWIVGWGCPQCGRHGHLSDPPDLGRVTLDCPCGWSETVDLAGWNQHGGEVHDH